MNAIQLTFVIIGAAIGITGVAVMIVAAVRLEKAKHPAGGAPTPLIVGFSISIIGLIVGFAGKILAG